MDTTPILLAAGLGNPGLRFTRTWHNLGFIVLDFWAGNKGLTFKPGRGDFTYLEQNASHGVVTFLKPTSYMNRSGIPIRELLRYRKLSPENLLVICDDVALPLGTIRIRRSGSSGGHKGLNSIIAELGTEEIARMRVGIFVEGWRGTLKNYVLSKIPDALFTELGKVIEMSANALDCILSEGVETAMNRFNRNYMEEESD